MNLQVDEKYLRDLKAKNEANIQIEINRTKKVCERFARGDVDFPVLLSAVTLAETEIRKAARTRDVLGLVLGDE